MWGEEGDDSHSSWVEWGVCHSSWVEWSGTQDSLSLLIMGGVGGLGRRAPRRTFDEEVVFAEEVF